MLRRPPRSTLFPYTRSSDLAQDLIAKVAGTAVGQTVNLTFLRALDGKPERHAVSVALAERPEPVAIEGEDRKSTRLNSSHQIISYAVFCLKKKNNQKHTSSP